MRSSSAVQYLKDYVAIPSVNPMQRSDLDAAITCERRYAEHLRAQLARMKLDCTLVGSGERISVIGEARATDAIDTVLIASHLDTVPVDGMTIAPFDPDVRDERMYGRGTCDTKAGMAALVAALERVLAQGRLRRNVLVVGEADEELTSIGVNDVLASLSGRKVDWVLATEPTGMRLVTAHKGRASVHLRATGRACHSSDPDRGSNAVVALCRVATALQALHEQLRSRTHSALGSPTISVSSLHGGTAPNVVPDDAVLIADRRMLPGETEAEVRAEIEQAIAAAGAFGQVLIEAIELGKDALGTDHAHVAVKACQRGLGALELATEPDVAAFATDAGPFAAAGIAGVVMGPGYIEQAHTADEFVPLDQVDAMQRFFEHLLSGGEPG